MSAENEPPYDPAAADPLYDHCRSLPGTTEDVKWGNNLVFSVADKMYASFDLPLGYPFGFKTEEGFFDLLIQQPGISPAPYLARARWVAIADREVRSEEEMKELLTEAHRLVALKLSRKKRRALGLEELTG